MEGLLYNGVGASSTTRKAAFVPAPALSDRIKECIAILFKIKSVTVADTTKDGNGDSCLVMDVCIQHDTSEAAKSAVSASSDAAAAGEPSSTTILQIQRTFKELKELEKVVTHWSDKHVYLDPQYGVAECSYCAHFYSSETAKLWPGSLTRLTTSKRKLEKQYEACINDYVFHARLPRPSDLECQGFDHIPSIVTRFLLKEIPMSF